MAQKFYLPESITIWERDPMSYDVPNAPKIGQRLYPDFDHGQPDPWYESYSEESEPDEQVDFDEASNDYGEYDYDDRGEVVNSFTFYLSKINNPWLSFMTAN